MLRRLTNMKTYKDIAQFRRRVAQATDWADYFKLEGRMYQIYEYGDSAHGGQYVFFVNKRTHDMVEVQYTLPSVQWVKIPDMCEEDNKPHSFKRGGVEYGNMQYCIKCLRRESEQVEKGEYRLHDVFFIPKNVLWREII